VLGRLLREKKMTIGTVESCTGGSLAQTLVSVPGASDYFQGSFLTYTNELKNRLVDVSQDDLDTLGAVSREVVEQMAKNGREKLGVDLCISTSGVAGPDGGTEELPVGSIWIGIATKEKVVSKRFQFGDHRERNIQMTVLTALNLVRCEILGILIEKK
jgi:nicotinamide-nucleotide amidase